MKHKRKTIFHHEVVAKSTKLKKLFSKSIYPVVVTFVRFVVNTNNRIMPVHRHGSVKNQ